MPGRRTTAVLVVDGNEEHLALSVTALGRRGFKVSVADSSREGVRLALSQPFHAIILAHRLRDASGFDTLRTLAERLPDVPRIFVVPEGSEDLALRSLNAGASGYLVKTARYYELLPTEVEEQLAKAKARARILDQQKALEDTQARYREFVETSRAPIFVIDPAGAFIAFNDAMCATTGYSRDELLHLNLFDLLSADVFGGSARRLTDLIHGGPAGDLQFALRRKDSREVIVEVTPHLVRREGEVVGIEVLARDITDRRRAEKELKDLYGWLQAIYEATNDAFLLADKDLQMVQWNARALTLFQVDAMSMARHTADSLLRSLAARARDPSAVLDALEAYRANPESVVEGALEIAIPEPRVYSRLTAPVHSSEGTLIGRLWTFRDITERRRAEEQVRHQANLVENVSDAIISTDLDFNVTSWNKAAETIYGWKAEEVIGKAATEILQVEYLHEDSAEILRQMNERGHWKGEIIQHRKDGTPLHVLTSASLVRDTAGNPVEFVATNKDITERMRAEEALRTAQERLRTVVANTPIVLFSIDREGLFTLSEGKGLEVLGLKPGEVVGRSVFDVYRDVPELLENIRRALGGEAFTSVVEVAGHAFETLYLPRQDEDGRSLGVIGVATDITERMRTERVQAATYRISEAANSAESLQGLFQSIHRIVGELMPATNFYIALYDPGEDTISFPFFVDEYEGPPPPQKLGRGLTEYVLRTGKPLLASPEAFEDLVRRGEVELVGPPSIDWVGVPLIVKEKTIGVLVVQSYTGGLRYGEKEKDILTFVSEQVAMAIERKRAEEAVASAEAKFRALVEQSLVGIYIIQDGRIVYVNPKVAEILRYTPDEILSMKSLTDLVAEEDRALVEENIRRRLRGEIPSLQYIFRARRKDGSFVDFEVYGTRIDFNGRPAIMGTALDITERLRAENELRQSETKFRTLFEAAAEGIVLLDRRANILDINPAGETVVGGKRAELIGRNVKDFLPPEELERAREYVRSVLKGRPIEDPFEIDVCTLDNRRRSIEVRSRVVQGGGQEPYVEMVVHDVTDEKEMQRRLVQSERLASVGKLSAYLAHEINTPLTNISLLTSSVARRVEDPDLLEKLEKINVQRRMATNIISDLLKFSKHREINPSETDLRQVVEAALEQVEHHRRPEVAIAKQLGGRPVRAIVDPVQMQEVFLNLIKNAYEATARGSVTVQLEVRPDTIVFRVIDTGSGMSEGVLGHLFEPFFTTKKFGEGTGLGLPMCQNIVVAHGGRIEVSSAQGSGSTFSVYLPGGEAT